MDLDRPLGSPLPSVAQREYFQETVKTGRPTISDLVVDPVLGRRIITIAVPVVRQGLLILEADLVLDALQAMVASQQSPAISGIITLIDRKSTILAGR